MRLQRTQDFDAVAASGNETKGSARTAAVLAHYRDAMRRYRPYFEGGDDDPPKDPPKDPPVLDMDDPKVKEAVEAIVQESVAGLKSNSERLIEENRTLTERNRELAPIVEAFKGYDPEKVKTVFARLEESEEAKLIADGKLDQVVEKRFARKEADLTNQIETLQGELTTAQGETARWRTTHNGLKIQTVVGAACDKLKLFSHAKPDALAASEAVFVVNDEGNIVAPDRSSSDGKLLMGKDGKSPLQPEEWLEGMKPDRPHWWPAPLGGGAVPTEVLDSGVTGFTTEQLENMPQKEFEEHRKAGRIK
jgi:hypothetical protein